MKSSAPQNKNRVSTEVLGLFAAGALVFVGVAALMGFYLGSGND